MCGRSVRQHATAHHFIPEGLFSNLESFRMRSFGREGNLDLFLGLPGSRRVLPLHHCIRSRLEKNRVSAYRLRESDRTVRSYNSHQSHGAHEVRLTRNLRISWIDAASDLPPALGRIRSLPKSRD